jgi:RNA polymerase sigma factor (sigma-70 family)
MWRSSAYKSATDPELARMCLQGDSMAWETLLVRYRRLMYSIPAQFRFQPEDCDEVYQTVSLTLYTQLHAVQDIAKLHSWIRRTTLNLCLKLVKQNRKHLGTEDAESAEEVLDPADFEKNAIEADLLHHICETVASMPKRCRLLLEMLFLQPVAASFEEVAQAVGLSVDAISPERARCLGRLVGMMQERGVI